MAQNLPDSSEFDCGDQQESIACALTRTSAHPTAQPFVIGRRAPWPRIHRNSLSTVGVTFRLIAWEARNFDAQPTQLPTQIRLLINNGGRP
jgi:hypothetical protein